MFGSALTKEITVSSIMAQHQITIDKLEAHNITMGEKEDKLSYEIDQLEIRQRVCRDEADRALSISKKMKEIYSV